MGILMAVLERVLHVEDDPSIRMVTSLALEKVGKLKVLSCEGGMQALAQAGTFDPQVILLDVMMPELDGPATLAQLREKIDLSERLVLFMTAKVQQQEQDFYQSIGAFGVIIKPFDPMTLAAQLQEHWARFLGRQRP
jgi:two-component system OmpR family response regulator